MKQILPPAKFPAPFIALVVLAMVLANASCATLPRASQSEVHVSQPAPSTAHALQVNINTASPKELEQLPGIGRGIAERIIAHRQQYGPFRRAEHLMMVQGISDGKFRDLRTMIVVE